MQNKPLQLSPAGFGKKNSFREPACRPVSIFFCALLLLLLSLSSGQGKAAGAAPSQRLDVRFDLGAGKLLGTSTITVPPSTPLVVQLGNLTIEKISGTGTAFDRKPGLLNLAAATTDRQVVITYSLTAPKGPGLADNLISPEDISLSGFWHPVLSVPVPFSLSAQLPLPFEAVSEADTISTLPGPNTKTIQFHFSRPLRFRHFIAGRYVINKYPFGDNQELYTYFFKEDEELGQQYLQKSLAYLKRYQELIGPYPYQRFSVVENRLPTGTAMPTFTLLGQAVVRLPFITETSLGHEILHSWFGNSISSPKENWVEGLTTYLADQAYAADRGEGYDFRKHQIIKYMSYVHDDNAMPLRAFRGSGGHLAGGNEAERAVGYGKASMLFHMLRKKVGDETFKRTLQAFFNVHRHGTADWDSLRQSFEKVSGQQLSAFFSQWLDRQDLPALTVRDARLEMEKGRQQLTFLLVQKSEKPYQLEVPITLIDSAGTSRRQISIEQAETRVKIPLKRPPEELIIDGDYDLMRKLAAAELPPVWSRFLGAGKRLVITPPKEGRGPKFASLARWLQEQGSQLVAADEVKESDLTDAALLFLGSESKWCRALFAVPKHPSFGCVLEVRPNPLNPEQVAVLVSAEDDEEVDEALNKLRHYGKYSYLHFTSGALVDKRTAKSDQGIRLTIDPAPAGLATSAAVPFSAIIDQALGSRVIYVGESHARYPDHLLQLRVIRELFARDPKLAIGMEMFNHASQPVLDKYLAGGMTEQEFLKKSNYYQMWGFDYRLYRDLIDFARHNKLQVVALNIEKELVSKVYKGGGTMALTEAELARLPPERDLSIHGYRDRMAEVFDLHEPPESEGNARMLNGFFQAQSIWDETMAATIAGYLKKNPDHRMVVVAGQGHTTKDSGIPPRVARRLPVRQLTLLNAAEQQTDPAVVDYLLFLEDAELPPLPQFGIMLAEKEGKMEVAGLLPHGRAKEMGFKEKDVLLAIDGQPVTSLADLKIIMLYKKNGDRVVVRINRPRALLGDKILELDVTL